MSEFMANLLCLLDHAPVVTVGFDDTVRWPAGERDRLIAAGVLVPSAAAEGVICDECGESHDVMAFEQTPDTALVRCSEGIFRIPIVRLQQWQFSLSQLPNLLGPMIELSGGSDEIVRDRLWRLGKRRWAGMTWNVFFGRALQRADAWQVLNQAALPARSVVFVPAKTPLADSRIERMPLVIPLNTVLSWTGERLVFDQEAVEQELESTAAEFSSAPAAKMAPQRRDRAKHIRSVRNELTQHLRSARDFAQQTLERTGTPALLPRPTMEFLAKQVGVNRSTISRCFEDKELSLMWELAADVDRLLSAASCR